MRDKDRLKLIAEGLGQIPVDGLERLRAVLADPTQPVLLTGDIYEPGKGG